jgi:hypothetical protein
VAAPVETPLIDPTTASPMKMVALAVLAPKDEALALLVDCEQTREDMKKTSSVISDQDSDGPPNKNEAVTVKAIKQTGKPKDNKGKQKEKERKKEKPEMTSTNIDTDEADDVEPKKGKQKGKGKQREKERKKKKPEMTSTDIDMDDANDFEPTERKQHEAAPTKRELQLEAEIKKLRQLIKTNKATEESADFNADSNADSATTDDDDSSESEEQDAKSTKKGKAPAKKPRKPPAKDNPELFSYYKTLGDDSHEMALNMKLGFTRQMFVNWWPEEPERQDFGKKAYSDALDMFRNVIILEDDDNAATNKKRKGELLTYIRAPRFNSLFDSTVSTQSPPEKAGE